MDNLPEIKASVYHSAPKKDVPVPKVPFEKFIRRYKTIGDVIETDEWKEIYSNYYDFEEIDKSIKIDETNEEMNSYSPARQREEIIKCMNSFSYFCIKYAKITHPMFGIIPFIPYTYQKRVVDCYGKHRFNIMSKFRQGGLTTVSVMWAVWRCLFKTSQKIMVVSKSDREAIAAGETAKSCIEALPAFLKPESDTFNKHEKQFSTTQSVLYFYTINAARSKSITILIIDEAAFIPDMHNHWKAIFPVILTGGSCEVISTVSGMGNWYAEKYHEIIAGKDKHFNIIELDYWEHPLYNDPKWMEETRSTLGEKGWRQEIERSFEGSGSTWLNSVIISVLREKTRKLTPTRMSFNTWKNGASEKVYEWDEGALWWWNEPIDGHEYIIGTDCAAGNGDEADNSCFQVIDASTLEQVAEFYSNTVPPHVFAQILNEIGYYYNSALIVVENASHGLAVLSALQHDLVYENLYFEDNKHAAGLSNTKTKRPLFLQSLQQRLLNGTLRINSYRFVTELNTFIFNPNNKKAEAAKGKHDDAIMALSFALYVRDAQFRSLPVGMPMHEEAMQVFKSKSYEEIKREIINESDEDFLDKEEVEDISLLGMLDNTYTSRRKFRRKLDTLLNEFGWMLFLPIWLAQYMG